MPTLAWNSEYWGRDTDWRRFGEEWSKPWGGSDMQWHGVLLPRIHRFLPAGCIVEIACGFGRWTQFLKAMCSHLIAVDLVEKCVEGCKQRFADCTNISYYVNDGRSLKFVSDASVDFVFSFDSLVHAEPDVILAYVSQLSRILKPNGAAFLHHSNLGAYPMQAQVSRIPKVRGILSRIGLFERSIHNRDPGMTAPLMHEFASRSGLTVASQETVNWVTRSKMFDCFTVLTNGGPSHTRAIEPLKNHQFMRSACQLAKIAPLYRSI